MRTLVAIRSTDFNAVKVTEAEFEGKQSFAIWVEDGKGSHLFSFADAHEVRAFAKRLDDAMNGFID